MKVKLTQFNVGNGRRFMVYSEAGDVLRSMPTNGWSTEAGARRWCQKNGHTVISVERIKDSVDSIREKYLGDAEPMATKVDPSFVTAMLNGISGGKDKTISIPKDFVNKVIDNAMEWAQKDKSFANEWDKASHAEKRALMVKKTKEYIVKFKWAIASGLKKYGVFDSVDVKDSLSKADQAKYSRFLVVAEDMFGKMIRPAGGSYYRKYNDALRAAKSLQGKNTHHVYVEGEYSNGQMEMKPVYEWRNSKKTTKDVADCIATKYAIDVEPFPQFHKKDLSKYAKDPWNAPYPADLKKDIAELKAFKEIVAKMRREVHPGPKVNGWSEYEKGLEKYPFLQRKITLGLVKFYNGDLTSLAKAETAILGKV